MKTSRLIKRLQAIVGEQYVLYHPEDRLVFEYDGSIDKAMPQVVVFPSNTEQVSQVVAVAYEEGVPIVGRGSGTGLSGGAVASMGGVQVVLTRMNRILEIDSANRIAVVQPGVINYDLDQEAHKYGLRYAPDPSSQKACSIGGNVAENAGGPHCLFYGVTTNHVLAVETVLEDGSLVWLGDRVRDVPGYDLRGVFIGSEGTFGLATTVVARLIPLPEVTKTFLGIYPDVDSAGNAVSTIIGQGIVPAALEMIDAMTIKAVEKVMKAGYPQDAGAVLLVELEGLREEVDDLSSRVESALWECGAKQVRTAEDSTEREKLWEARKKAIGSLGTIAPNYYLVDGVVPRTKISQALRAVDKITQKHGLLVANILHAGDGNLHPCILFDERQPGITRKVLAAGADILQVCVELGGTLTGEHGVGLEKRNQMPLIFTEADMETMKRVRNAFAPKNRLNPGKIFPGGPEYEPELQKHAVAAAGPGSYI